MDLKNRYLITNRGNITKVVLVHISIDYENLVKNLMEIFPSIYAVAIIEIEKDNEIAYSTENWEISADVKDVCSSWDSMDAPYIIISGIKYTMLECEIDNMVATSIQGKGHIVGCKDDERRIITYVEPNGDIKAAIVEISRTLAKISPKKPDMDTAHVDPKLKSEIENFLGWINNPYGLQSLIKYNLQKNNSQIISELAKIYDELVRIINS